MGWQGKQDGNQVLFVFPLYFNPSPMGFDDFSCQGKAEVLAKGSAGKVAA
jgi:hypothetical protein